MGIRLLKSQFLAALSFALLAGCSTDSGVISKKEANQQISSSSQSQIQRLNEEPALSRHHQDEAEQPIAAKEDRQSDGFVAVIPPAQNSSVQTLDSEDLGVEAAVVSTPLSENDELDVAAAQQEAERLEREAAELAAAQQEAERLEREAAELAAAQQEAERLEREAAELAAARQEAERLEREAAELAAAQQEAERLEREAAELAAA